MTLTKILAATALCAAIATPVMAQEIPYGANGRTGYHTQYTGGYGGGHRGYHRNYGPGAFVAGAIGTAAAIATAPLYGDSYAYYGEPDYAPPVYQQRNTYGGNGFVCQPGTWYTNSYGSTQYCQ